MCGVEGAQGHAGLANFSKTLLGTPVRQVEGTRCDPCLFMKEKLDVCIGLHVDDMLAVGPSEPTKTLLQELAKGMAMRWGMVTQRPLEILGRSWSKTRQGYNFGIWFW